MSVILTDDWTFKFNCLTKRPHDIQHNDYQHNDTQHNDTQHNDTQHNDIQHNYIQHDNKQNATLIPIPFSIQKILRNTKKHAA